MNQEQKCKESAEYHVEKTADAKTLRWKVSTDGALRTEVIWNQGMKDFVGHGSHQLIFGADFSLKCTEVLLSLRSGELGGCQATLRRSSRRKRWRSERSREDAGQQGGHARGSVWSVSDQSLRVSVTRVLGSGKGFKQWPASSGGLRIASRESAGICYRESVTLLIGFGVSENQPVTPRGRTTSSIPVRRARSTWRRAGITLSGRLKICASPAITRKLVSTEWRRPGLDEESSNPQAAVTQSPGDTRHMSFQRCMLELIHACQCKDVSCSFSECQKMKRVVQHTKRCQQKANGNCPICKVLIAVCCHHAKHCQQNICSAPFCRNIKEKLKQQQQQEMQDEMQEVQEGSVGQMDQLPQVLEAEAGASQQAQPESLL
ncbi:uncharacterized protein [Saccopteryx leptura]|uniref:uncharacterized protein n=1 Tax=Saccopteryx leptura TaxID=249018 RepID=UPI00339D1DC0